MNPANKATVIMFFLLLMCLLSPGVTKASGMGTSRLDLLHHTKGANSRKLMGFDTHVVDYDYAVSNPKHDPRGRRGGGSSKNP